MFAPLCYPPAGSEAIVTSKLVLAMIEAGWKVTVISQSDFGHYYPASENDKWKPLLSVVKNIAGINGKGITARLMGTALTDRIRSMSWVSKAVIAGLVVSRKEKYDFVLSRVAPQYGHLPALIVSKTMRIPWIASWSDPMPPQKAPPPYGGGLSAKISLFADLYCKTIVSIADWHIFPCERLMRYYWKMYPALEKKSSGIPHIALKSFIIPQTETEDVFSLCHTGSIVFRNPSVFLEGLKRFIAESMPTETVKVIFIGNSKKEVLAKVRESGVSEIVWAESPKTYEETQLNAAAACVLVVIEAPCEEGIFSPSKFVDFVQTGRPILAVSPVNGTLHDVLSSKGGGIAADCRSVESVKDAITNLYVEWRHGTLDYNFSSDSLFALFSEQYVLGKYSELFRILGKLRNE